MLCLINHLSYYRYRKCDMTMTLFNLFQLILKEMDDEISDDELDEIILEVCQTFSFDLT